MMMRHFKWYTWLGIILLFVISTIGFAKLFDTISYLAHSDTMTVKVESEEVNHQIQLNTETKEAGKLTSIKSIPFTQVKDIDQLIKEWANKQENAFFSNMKEADLLLDHRTSAHFSLQSKVMPIKDDIYNIAITAEQSAEQTSDHKVTKTFTVDLDKEDFISFDGMTDESLTSDKLFKLLQENRESDLDQEKYQKEYEKIDDINWTAGKENIVFYFNTGEISDDEEKISVPLMKFYPYLNKSYYDAMINDELDEKIKQKEEEERKKKEAEEAKNKEALQSKKLVALTFDDGPDPDNTPRILDALDKYDAKATFFNLANNVRQYPDITQQIIDEGHELGNHSISHANLNAVKKEKAASEINDSKQIIEEVTGNEPSLFRPPYGNYEDDTENMIHNSNQEIIMWSVDTQDWNSQNSNAIYGTVKANVVPGSIVLMHDIHPTTADAVPRILKYLDDEGYEMVTVSELMPYIEGTNNGAYFGY